MPVVELEGKKIHYLAVEGEGVKAGRPRLPEAPLVFVHGAGGSHETWLRQLAYFASRYPALVIDLPGHGGSDGEGLRQIEAYRDFVRRFLDAVGIERAILVGHSMGGAIALSFALAYPKRLKGIVLVGTGARLKVHPKVFEALRGDPEEAVRLLVQWAYAPSAPPEVLRQGEVKWLQGSLKVMEGDFLACDAFDLMEEVGGITLPTLIVCGTEDRLTPIKYAEYLHRKIQGSTLTLVSGAGHMVMLERPDDVNRALGNFLQRLT